jgi:hypothetical protein
MPGQLELFVVPAAPDPAGAGPAPDPTAAPQPEPDDGRTTDPQTWLCSPENLARFGAFTREADGRRRAILERERKEAKAVDPAGQQQYAQQPGPGTGPGQGQRP